MGQIVKLWFAAAWTWSKLLHVNHARDRNRLRRGKGRNRIDLDRLTGLAVATDDDLLELNDALDRLAKSDARKVQLIEMHYFGGMTAEETADALSLSVHQVRRELRAAQAWLRSEIDPGKAGASVK